MSSEMLADPFLFIATFFESFILVTLLSAPARKARGCSSVDTADLATLPSVAIIVPCWNEAATVGATCDSLLALDYPKEKLKIILVNNCPTHTNPKNQDKFL